MKILLLISILSITFLVIPMQVGLVAPNYVRSVILHNQSGVDVSVQVSYKSGETANFTVGNDAVNVQRDIDQGGYSTVDPVLEFKVNFGQGQLTNVSCADAQHIEIRKYVIHGNKTLERVEA